MLYLQPPSGGCVLKLLLSPCYAIDRQAATFGWLCVETLKSKRDRQDRYRQPPSGGCVLKRLKFELFLP